MVWTMRYLEGRSPDEVMAALGITHRQYSRLFERATMAINRKLVAYLAGDWCPGYASRFAQPRRRTRDAGTGGGGARASRRPAQAAGGRTRRSRDCTAARRNPGRATSRSTARRSRNCPSRRHTRARGPMGCAIRAAATQGGERFRTNPRSRRSPHADVIAAGAPRATRSPRWGAGVPPRLPDLPLERVQGQLPSATLVPCRACAAVTAAVLATSAVAPGIAAATDGQGVAAPAPESPPPPQVSDIEVGGGAVAPASGGSSAHDEPSADAAQPSDRGPRPDQRAHEPESGAGAPAHDEPDDPSATAMRTAGGLRLR